MMLSIYAVCMVFGVFFISIVALIRLFLYLGIITIFLIFGIRKYPLGFFFVSMQYLSVFLESGVFGVFGVLYSILGYRSER